MARAASGESSAPARSFVIVPEERTFTGRSAELVSRAKSDRLPVTAEVTPHHLLLTENLLGGYDSVYKVNPPLRSDEDRRLLWSTWQEASSM